MTGEISRALHVRSRVLTNEHSKPNNCCVAPSNDANSSPDRVRSARDFAENLRLFRKKAPHDGRARGQAADAFLTCQSPTRETREQARSDLAGPPADDEPASANTGRIQVEIAVEWKFRLPMARSEPARPFAQGAALAFAV